MINIIGWFKGLPSLANNEVRLLALQEEVGSTNAELNKLKQEYETTQRALSGLVDRLDLFETEQGPSSDDKIDEKITEWANDNLDDRIKDYDYSDIISKELRNHDYICEDDLKNAIETAMEDIEVPEKAIKSSVQSEIESDWFEAQVTQIVDDLCKKFIAKEETEEVASNNDIINTMLKHKIEEQVVERMESKFGEGWDGWFEEHTRYCVKNVLNQLLTSAYEQTKETK